MSAAGQPTRRVGVEARAQARRAALETAAHGLAAEGLPLNTPVRVLWRVQPSGARSLHLVASGWTPGGRHQTLGDWLVGEGRL